MERRCKRSTPQPEQDRFPKPWNNRPVRSDTPRFSRFEFQPTLERGPSWAKATQSGISMARWQGYQGGETNSCSPRMPRKRKKGGRHVLNSNRMHLAAKSGSVSPRRWSYVIRHSGAGWDPRCPGETSSDNRGDACAVKLVPRRACDNFQSATPASPTPAGWSPMTPTTPIQHRAINS